MRAYVYRAPTEGAQLASEIHDELHSHIAETADALVDEGWPEEAAWAEAHRRFGDLQKITASCTREKLPNRTMFQKLNLTLILMLLAGVSTLFVRAKMAANQTEAEMAKLTASVEALESQVTVSSQPSQIAENVEPVSVVEHVAAFEERTGMVLEKGLREAVLGWLEDKPGYGDKVAEFGDDAVPVLVAIMSGELKIDGDKSALMRFVAANYLGDTKSSVAVLPLIDALGDPWFNVRRCAALALGKLGDPSAIAPLEELAKNDPYVYRGRGEEDPVPLVRIDAEKALEMLR